MKRHALARPPDVVRDPGRHRACRLTHLEDEALIVEDLPGLDQELEHRHRQADGERHGDQELDEREAEDA
jgi:hypothetical protein